MKQADDIKRRYEQARIDTRSGADKAVLEKMKEAYLSESEAKPETVERTFWRNIMKSKLTKFAVAACVVIAVIIGVKQFTGSVNISTVAFADISEAMKNVPWMHQVGRGFERGINGTGEQWIGFEAKIHAGKWANGKVTFSNMKEKKSYTYDPQAKTITILYQDSLPIDLSSPVSLLESMYKMLKEQGAQIITKEAKYDGQKVQLQEISLTYEGQSQIVRLYIQPDSKLLLAAQVKGTDAKGNITMDGEVTFSYPQTGPSDIYDLGVPRDAKIISNLQQ
jgi:hypothetical protein